MKKYCYTFKVILVLIISLTPAVLGLIEAPFGVGIALAALGLLWYIVCIVFNAIYMAKRMNKILTTPADYWFDYFENQKDDVRADSEQARRKVVRSIRIGYIYCISLLIATALIACGLGMIATRFMLLAPDLIGIWGRALILVVLAEMVYAAFGIVPASTLLYTKTHGKPHANKEILQEKDYPLLYAVAGRAAEAVGYTGKYNICRDLDSNGISVTEEYGAVYVYISPTPLAVMAENELYTVLLHEFSHAIHKDTKWSARFSDAVAKFNTDGKIKGLLFAFVGEKIYESTDLYSTYASLELEQRADEAVKEYGNPQAFIDCTAKDSILSHFLARPNPDLYFNIYESEAPIADYYERRHALFEDALVTQYGQLKEVVLRTLPGKSDTHPTLFMRMKSLGVTDFDISARPEGKFLEETKKYLADCSAIRALNKESWEENRKTEYLEVKERLKKFEAKLAAGQTPNKYELWQSLTDYSLSAPEKALALADEILGKDSEDKRALAVKGMMLCAMDRPEGLAILRKAVDKANFYSAATLYNRYGYAVLCSGDEKLLEESRSEQTTVAQRALDCAKVRYTLKKPTPAQILPCDLPEAEITDMCCVLNDYGSDLDSVYIAKQGNAKIDTYIVLYNLKTPHSREYDDSFFSFLHMLESMDRFFIFYSANGKLAQSIRKKGIKLK